MIESVKILKCGLFVSFKILKSKYNISSAALDKWVRRKIGKVVVLSRERYISYDTIPEPSRKKLPSKEDLIVLAQQENNDKEIEQLYFR